MIRIKLKPDANAINALRVLNQTNIETCNAVNLLQYAHAFASFCKCMSDQKPQRSEQAFWFMFDQTQTNSYWLHMAFVCYKLGAVMQLYVASAVSFEMMLDKHCVQSSTIPSIVSKQLVHHLKSSIGIISWMLREGRSCSLFVDRLASTHLSKSEESFHALRAWTLWIVAGQKQNDIDLEELDLELRRAVCKLYSTCQEIIQQHDLIRFKAMKAIHNDCIRQILVNKGDYWAFDKADIGQAVTCWTAAMKLNWKPTEAAERVLNLNMKYIQKRVVAESMVHDLEPFACADHKLLMCGLSPFADAIPFEFISEQT